MNKSTIFIDESGTLPDTQDQYIILAALATSHPNPLSNILGKFRKNTPKKGSRKNEHLVPEFKFHYVGELTRRNALMEINSLNARIYILVVDKMGRKIADTASNYFKLLKLLIEIVLKQEDINQIKLDRHFRKGVKLMELDKKLATAFKDVEILQVDSLTDSRIDLADFIAGAMLRKYNKYDNQFACIFADQIKVERMVKWNEL